MTDGKDLLVILGEPAQQRLQDLRFFGTLSQVDANARNCRLVSTSHGQSTAADHIDMTVLLDSQGQVADCKYRSQAQGERLLLYDLMAESIIACDADQVEKITVADCAQRFPQQEGRAIPEDWQQQNFPVLIKLAMAMRGGEPHPQPASSAAQDTSALPWDEVGLFEKVRRLETVLDEQVRPMLATDGGGIELIDLRDRDVLVQYSGACGSCSASVGGTMVFIEETLNSALGVELHLVVEGMDEPESFMDI